MKKSKSKNYRIVGVIEADIAASSAEEARTKAEEILYGALDRHAKRLRNAALGIDEVRDGDNPSRMDNLLDVEKHGPAAEEEA